MDNLVETIKEYYNCCNTRAEIILKSHPRNELIEKMEVYKHEKSIDTTKRN